MAEVPKGRPDQLAAIVRKDPSSIQRQTPLGFATLDVDGQRRGQGNLATPRTGFRAFGGAGDATGSFMPLSQPDGVLAGPAHPEPQRQQAALDAQDGVPASVTTLGEVSSIEAIGMSANGTPNKNVGRSARENGTRDGDSVTTNLTDQTGNPRKDMARLPTGIIVNDEAEPMGLREGPIPEYREARRQRVESGDLIGQLQDFFATSSMEDGQRRYLRKQGGIQILVHYTKNFNGRSVLQVRNVDGLDYLKMGDDGIVHNVERPLDEWVDFIGALTDPSFEDGAEFYSAILVSGEADPRINKWCDENGWESVRPQEGFSRTIPDSHLLVLDQNNNETV